MCYAQPSSRNAPSWYFHAFNVFRKNHCKKHCKYQQIQAWHVPSSVAKKKQKHFRTPRIRSPKCFPSGEWWPAKVFTKPLSEIAWRLGTLGMEWEGFGWWRKEFEKLQQKCRCFKFTFGVHLSWVDESPTCQTKCVSLNKLFTKKTDVLAIDYWSFFRKVHAISGPITEQQRCFIDLSMRPLPWLQKIVPSSWVLLWMHSE